MPIMTICESFIKNKSSEFIFWLGRTIVTVLAAEAPPSITLPESGEMFDAGVGCGRVGADFLLGAAMAINFLSSNIHLKFHPSGGGVGIIRR